MHALAHVLSVAAAVAAALPPAEAQSPGSKFMGVKLDEAELGEVAGAFAESAAFSGGSSSLPSYQDWWDAAFDVMPSVHDLRRDLHAHPEVMFTETWTSARIQSELSGLNVSFTAGWAKNTKAAELKAKGMSSGPGGTGVVAQIGTGKPPCVLLRADIDALPIKETPLVPFVSQNDGKSHACGHDSHIAMLVGAAALLKRREATTGINGTIRLIFQPAEEGGAGGKRMVEEGVLTQDPPVQGAVGFHQWPFIPLGTIGGRPGTFLAATELFEITVSGIGGHAAMPHAVVDPIVASAAVITALQSIAARETSPLDSAVVSVTMVHAGDAYNVIPSGAQICGTIRSLTDSGLQRLRTRVAEVVENVASGHRCNVTVSWSPDAYPPTYVRPLTTHTKSAGPLIHLRTRKAQKYTCVRRSTPQARPKHTPIRSLTPTLERPCAVRVGQGSRGTGLDHWRCRRYPADDGRGRFLFHCARGAVCLPGPRKRREVMDRPDGRIRP